MEGLSNQLSVLDIQPHQQMDIDNKKFINFVFDDGLDFYDVDSKCKLLGVPNLYCKKYFDDEDFIYARLKLNYNESKSENADKNDMMDMMDIINLGSLSISDEVYKYIQSIYQNINYLFYYVNKYYFELKSFRPLERVYSLPADYLECTEQTVINIKYMLDKEYMKYVQNDIFTLEMFNELLYGLRLITCHIKMICNHYCMNGKTLKNMEEKHIGKIMRLVNNLCVVMIFLRV